MILRIHKADCTNLIPDKWFGWVYACSPSICPCGGTVWRS